ncbi:uncharacterized protein [Argopecten irradians]
MSVLMADIDLIDASSESIIKQFTLPTVAANIIDIPVDTDMTSLNISISGPTDVTEATLTDPDGVVETFVGRTSLRWLENNTLFMTIQNPGTGSWILTRIDTSKVWTINITASSGINIDFRLIHTDDAGFHTILNRNPIVGQTYTFVVIASNINTTFEPLSLVVQNEEDETLITSTLNMSFTSNSGIGHTVVTIPAQNFYIQLSGTEPSGSPFIRSSWRQVTPVIADLIVYPIIGQSGSDEDITYILTNYAPDTKTYDVTMTSTVTSSNTRSHTTFMSESVENVFIITTPSDTDSLSYTVSLSEPGTPTLIQSSAYTLQLSSSLCTITTTSNECDNANSTCSAYRWSATAVFNFKVSEFVVTRGVSITDRTTDKTYLDISGDCCIYNMSLTAYTINGNGCQLRLPSNVELTKEVDEPAGSGSIVYIIIGATGGGFISLVFIAVVVCKIITKGNSVHSKEPSMDVPEDPFASLSLQRPTTAPVKTTLKTRRFPLLEKDFLKSYNVRPPTRTGQLRPLSSRPTSGHFSLHVNSRPTSFR